MKKQILASLLIASQAHAILESASSLKGAPTNDTFISYQWSLMPTDQYTDQDLDDTHPKRVFVDPKFNIGWRNFDAQMKRDVIVAVIDSGLNVSHPELKDRLVPGFNFTPLKNEPTNIYDDKIGHGTHIAGIMASISANQDGISGLSGKIKIMPLKVYNDSEDRQTGKGQSNGTLIERVIKAIDFAIANKADVINLSLGWPRIANSDQVRQAFQRAADAGIVMVAAAGNNGHNGQIYPCAYTGVICVASIDLDSKMSNFSNRGGHVDIAAPGQEILSLWPLVMSKTDFGITGYEVKSGTSQAAPFISAAAAILKGIYPNESARQIRARLLLAAQDWDRSIAYGALQMEKAIQADPQKLIGPVFKGVEVAEVDPQTLRFTLPLTIEKGSASMTPKVQVTSSQKQIQLSVPRKVSETANEIQFQIQGSVSNLQISNQWSYSVTVNGRTFTNQILLQLPLSKMSMSRSFLSVSTPDMIDTNGLMSVYNPRNLPDVAFWSYLKKENGLQVSVWKRTGEQLIEKSILLPGISEPGFSMIAEDFNFDGVTDYLLMGFLRDETKTENDPKGDIVGVRLFYLNLDLQITHNFEVKDNGTFSVPRVKDKSQISFVKFTKPGLKPLKVPLYWDSSLISDSDMNPNYPREPNYEANRVYYVEPLNDHEMAVRTPINGDFGRQVREALNSSVLQEINVLATRVQSASESKDGKANLLFSIGNGINNDVYMIPIADLGKPLPSPKQWIALPESAYDLAMNSPQEAWEFARGQIENRTEFQAIYSGMLARSLRLKGVRLYARKLNLPERGEEIVDITKTFYKGREGVTFYETTDFLRVYGSWQGRRINDKALVYRSTFLPGKYFSQSFVPVVVSPEQIPGILVNNSQIFSNTILTYSLSADGKLVSPISRTFDLPKGCFMRNPQIGPGLYSQLSFLCKENAGYELRFLDLK